MKSEVKLLTPGGLKVYVAIGITMAAIVITAMVLYPDAIRAILYSTAAAILVGGCGRGLFVIAHGWQSYRRARLENDRLAVEVDQMRQHSRFYRLPRTDGYIDVPTGIYHAPAIGAGGGPAVVDGQAVEVERRRTALDLLDKAPHFSLIGSTNGGKTTLANHIIDALGGDCYVCDPAAKFNTWSPRAEIVGGGEDYDAISRTISGAHEEMRQRFTAGPGDYAPLVLVIDEAPDVFDLAPGTLRLVGRIARRGRLVGVRLVLLSQSDFVRDLGDEWGSARKNLYRIDLHPELTKRNQGTIKHWDGSKELIDLCGPYTPPGRWFAGRATPMALPQPVEVEPDTDVAEFVRLVVEDGLSRRDACMQVFGVQYGGAIVGRLKPALDAAATTATED